MARGGCGLFFIAAKFKEHHSNVIQRFNVNSCRLIGDQAIEIARHSYRLIDAMRDSIDSELQQIRLSVLSQLCQALRKIGRLINVIDGSDVWLSELKFQCKLYFNLFSLYYNVYCNSTVWTIGYVVPFHAERLWNDYKIGYGILSMQGKESKHSAIKTELKMCTNRSTSQDEKGKWHQLARGSFVRNYYLPYHFPIDTYVPH